MLSLLNWNQGVFLPVDDECGTLNLVHATEIIELIGNEEAEPTDFAVGYVLDACQWRHQDEATRLELACQVGRWTAAKRPPEDDDVFLPQVCFLDDELVG